ncbi:MAG: thioesterase [Myxococcales bacterium]|nr:thioesterase [Myxococcales bacterium]
MPDARWFTTLADPPDATTRLLCLPHAGGQPAAFAAWPAHLPPTVELRVARLPGRAGRIGEPPIRDIDPLVEALGAAMRALPALPTVIFGHSMGAAVGFALCRWLARQGAPAPTHLVVAGRRAPHLPPTTPPVHDASDEALVAELRRLGGTPPQVLQHRELLELLLPMLRADYRIAETYHAPATATVDCPLLALGGEDDADVPPAALAAWGHHTTAAFRAQQLPGGHFFLHERPRDVIAALPLG